MKPNIFLMGECHRRFLSGILSDDMTVLRHSLRGKFPELTDGQAASMIAQWVRIKAAEPENEDGPERPLCPHHMYALTIPRDKRGHFLPR